MAGLTCGARPSLYRSLPTVGSMGSSSSRSILLFFRLGGNENVCLFHCLLSLLCTLVTQQNYSPHFNKNKENYSKYMKIVGIKFYAANYVQYNQDFVAQFFWYKSVLKCVCVCLIHRNGVPLFQWIRFINVKLFEVWSIFTKNNYSYYKINIISYTTNYILYDIYIIS
jgi:hypothetical protein